MSIRRMLPLVAAIAATFVDEAFATDANFFPPEIVLPAARFNPIAEPCMHEFTRLRSKAAQDGLSFLGSAREHLGSRDEICRQAGIWAQSEADIVRYIDTQGAFCGILVQSAGPFIQARSIAESLKKKVCAGDDSWLTLLPAATSPSR